MVELTQQRLRELLHYDPATGIWTRLVNRRRGRAGSVAGRINSFGYRTITISGKEFMSARLAWFYMTGEWPKADMEHKNLVRDDDRWENLREATHSQNLANRNAPANNRSGLKGVCWDEGCGKWLAQIGIHGKTIHLGRFDSKEQAHSAYRQAAQDAFGEFARVA